MTTRQQLREIGRKLAELREMTALWSVEIALKNFDPNQPRWPGGQSNGGQWRPAGGDVAQTEGIYDPTRMPKCLTQQALDHELCRMAKSAKCWMSADIRFNNCMKNVYIPPLEVGR
jgi:hypothetical protein